MPIQLPYRPSSQGTGQTTTRPAQPNTAPASTSKASAAQPKETPLATSEVTHLLGDPDHAKCLQELAYLAYCESLHHPVIFVMSRVDPSLPLDYILKVIGIDTEVGRLGKVLHEVKTSGGKDVGEAYAEILEALEGVVRRNAPRMTGTCMTLE